MKLTKEQAVSLKHVYDRGDSNHPSETYLGFRRRVHLGYGCIAVYWCGIWFGIEPDGYTHSAPFSAQSRRRWSLS